MSDILDTLDLTQKEKLNQFQAITQSNDIEASIKILEEYQWNLERSIQRFYEGGSANIFGEGPSNNGNSKQSPSRPSAPPPSSISTTTSSNNTTSANNNTNNNNRRHRSGIMALFMWPFGLAWNITWTLLSFATRLISRRSITSSQHHHRQQPQDPRSLANRFLREFEKNHGETHVPFIQEGYSQALEQARKELKFLLVILQSDEHDNTDSFCKETLTNSELIQFLQTKNVLVWGGNVGQIEGYQVSCTLQATTYPFLAIIALQQSSSSTSTSSSPKMSVVERLEGPMTPTTLIQRLDTTIQRHGTVLNRLKMERDQRDMERRLREEQDRAYRESLKADQEKERKAREEREALARQEEEERKAQMERELQLKKREQYIQYLYNTLPSEPSSDYQGKITKLNFRLGNGDRVIRQFKADDTIESLYQFVEIYPLIKNNSNHDDQLTSPDNYEHKYNFTIHSPFPRTVYDLNDKHKPLSDVPSLWPSTTLIVELDDEDEDED